jgi:hypothetical protein
MNADLTISTLSFKLRASDIKDGSERREVSRGVNLPEVMTVKSQDYTDSQTKKPGKRTVLRFDRYVAGTDGQPVAVSAYLVVAVPNDAAIVSADVLAVIARINGVIDATSPNLDLGEEIFITGEQ